MSKYVYLITMLSIVSLSFTACDKDDPEIPIDEEIITTLNYYLIPADGGSQIVLTFKDLDGDGGNAPEITGGTFAANQSYTGRLDLLNESESPAESVTEEIQEEDEEHQFFFQTNFTDLNIDYTDEDALGNPIGLSTTLTTGAAGSGTLTIILRHEPNKTGAGVSDGDIANAGGETDIEVEFPIDVE